ncbi:MAG: EAL domain-containing protein, partial [Pseudomonadales bacterium]|nr:EAL domain-containing protein [Pseudomonadales bacterium]
MTLRREVFIAVTALFVVLLCSSVGTHLYGERQRLVTEMQLHAHNAATAIDQLSPQEDIASVMTLRADVWFRSHYFRSIKVTDLQGKVLVERAAPLDVDGAPPWFVRMVNLPEATYGTDLLQAGRPVAILQLSIQPRFAYSALWAVFCEQVLLLVVLSSLTFILSALALRWLLRPLKQLEEQAAAICDRHFVENKNLPRTRELRQVMDTMNCMSNRLRVVFDDQVALTENLRSQSFLDPVTGLSNRRDFNARLQALGESEHGYGGCLMLVQVDDFGRYNFKYGHESGDECLRVIAAHLQTMTAATPDAIVSRRSGADFAVFVPDMSMEAVDTFASQLVMQFRALDILNEHRIYVGVACCQVLQPDHRLLSEADLALRQAQSQSQSGWKLYQDGDVLQVAREARQWYATLNRILLDHNILLHFQPVFLADSAESSLCEVYCRINMQNQLLPAGVFLPMAQRFGLAAAFDRLILGEILKQSAVQPPSMRYCVNLSAQALGNQEFLRWLDEWLAAHAELAARLVVEIPAFVVVSGYRSVENLSRLLRRHNAHLSLDHFGVHSATFGYLRSLPLGFLKIDRSFVRN